ncbi:hypothetical protein BV25DRAFT_1835447 [Artomyces pyxidatus]|uniref:Uncharacterized protein n=1 Tax=Artomyces pyxidatus TaxID=48021 RepID=A0ACB8TFG4_9AGAM|nr:hypothetical protein BV25DRAFT_1835447 [Artomyces pyxidatus]
MYFEQRRQHFVRAKNELCEPAWAGMVEMTAVSLFSQYGMHEWKDNRRTCTQIRDKYPRVRDRQCSIDDRGDRSGRSETFERGTRTIRASGEGSSRNRTRMCLSLSVADMAKKSAERRMYGRVADEGATGCGDIGLRRALRIRLSIRQTKNVSRERPKIQSQCTASSDLASASQFLANSVLQDPLPKGSGNWARITLPGSAESRIW